MNKRLFLIFHGRFPSEKAASLFAAESSSAFAKEGYTVTLIVSERKGALYEDPYLYYNVSMNFNIISLPTLGTFFSTLPRALVFWISYISFSVSTFFYIMKKSAEDDIIYSNEIFPLSLTSFLRKNCFYEMHDFPESKHFFFGWVLNRMRWILIHNKWKLEEVKRLFLNVSPNKLLDEPNAVSLKDFDITISQEDVRRKLGLIDGEKLVVYTGHLYSWKGVDTLAGSVAFLPRNYRILFIGGTSDDIANFTKKYGNNPQISIIGHVSHSQIPLWQKAADVLVLPNTAKEKISSLYTSPMKLFEYMASRKPIVATDIPSLREILSEENSILALPDDPQSLAKALCQAVNDLSGAKKISAQAFIDVSEHTWEKRAKRIINFINTIV
jgi:glycosyltransferase involved in cell wall biosynthesis